MKAAVTQATFVPDLKDVKAAATRISGVSVYTPLMPSHTYSRHLEAEILIKREDTQQVRSYKIRGAFNKISSLSKDQLRRGVVCASAGNHAQGVAFACNKMKINGTVYMPVTTPQQKVEQTRMFGGQYVEVVLMGDTFDDSYREALHFSEAQETTFIHPFDDEKVIEGQATIALEILEQSKEPIDYIFAPIGGGGLLAGISAVFKKLSPHTKIIGVEPQGAASMSAALEKGELVELDTIDRFVDGAAVKKVGSLNFQICRKYLDQVIGLAEGRICQTILDLYNKDAIVAEPAGAMSIAALEQFSEEIKGKRVVCILSGGNNDITRMAEIRDRAMLYNGLKHYFIVKFPQRAGALREFAASVLGPGDDITHFEYSKKHHRDNGPAVVGIELDNPDNLDPLVQRMKDRNFYGQYLNNSPDLFRFLL